jgi:ribosomal protein L18E
MALMMEAVTTSETSVNVYRLHGATTQNKVILILAAVRT